MSSLPSTIVAATTAASTSDSDLPPSFASSTGPHVLKNTAAAATMVEGSDGGGGDGGGKNVGGIPNLPLVSLMFTLLMEMKREPDQLAATTVTTTAPLISLRW